MSNNPLILVVDDNKDLRHLFLKNSVFSECRVIEASSFDEAISAIHDNEMVQIVAFIDIHLDGDRDGLDLIHYIRSTVSHRVVPYAWTADTTNEMLDKMLKAGALHVFYKGDTPFSFMFSYAVNSPVMELLRLVTRDTLTGLDNLYRFENEAKEILRTVGSRNYPEVLSLIFFDVDNFKEINDKYGHVFGDDVLKEVARILQDHRHIRPSDRVCRRSGDEFMILLPGVTDTLANEIGLRLQAQIGSVCKVKNDLFRVSFSISFGVGQITQGEVLRNGIDQSWKILQERVEEGAKSLNKNKANTNKRRRIA